MKLFFFFFLIEIWNMRLKATMPGSANNGDFCLLKSPSTIGQCRTTLIRSVAKGSGQNLTSPSDRIQHALFSPDTGHPITNEMASSCVWHSQSDDRLWSSKPNPLWTQFTWRLSLRVISAIPPSNGDDIFQILFAVLSIRPSSDKAITKPPPTRRFFPSVLVSTCLL